MDIKFVLFDGILKIYQLAPILDCRVYFVDFTTPLGLLSIHMYLFSSSSFFVSLSKQLFGWAKEHLKLIPQVVTPQQRTIDSHEGSREDTWKFLNNNDSK